MTRTVQLFSDLLSSRIEGCLKPTIFVTNSPYEVPRGAATRIQPATWRNSFSANDASRVFPNRHPFRLPRKAEPFPSTGFRARDCCCTRARRALFFTKVSSSPRLRALRPSASALARLLRRRGPHTGQRDGAIDRLCVPQVLSLGHLHRARVPPPRLSHGPPRAPVPGAIPRQRRDRLLHLVHLLPRRLDLFAELRRARRSLGPRRQSPRRREALASAAGSERPEEAPRRRPRRRLRGRRGWTPRSRSPWTARRAGVFANASAAAAMILTSYRWKGSTRPRVRARARLLGNTRRRRRRRTPR